MNVLLVNSSPRGERSHSLELAKYAAAKLGGQLTTVDLSVDEPPFLSGEVIAYDYGFMKLEQLSPRGKEIAAAQAKIVAQLKAADAVVIAAPMWNFNMPASLKAWFDLGIKVNDTWKMGEKGEYVGLLTNIKKVIVTGARGGVPAGAPYDMLAPHIKGLCGFLGMSGYHDAWVSGRDAEAIAPEKEKAKKFIDAAAAA